MRILIVVPRHNPLTNLADYRYAFPLGLAYISSVLKHAGHHVSCLNLNHRGGAVDYLISNALDQTNNYDFVCTGGLSTQYLAVKTIVDAVRRHASQVPIILGGGLMSSEPELMFEALNPDFMVLGEGEETVQELLTCVEQGGPLQDVKGIGYRGEDGEILCTNEREPIEDIDSLAWPDFEGFDFETYLRNVRPSNGCCYDLFDDPRPYPIIWSRSCPFQCTFCFHPLGNVYRSRSIDSVMEELEVAIRRYRINIIDIFDELLSYKKERVYEFCRRIKALLKKVPWQCKWSCQMRVDKMDVEMVRTMRDAGCYILSLGLESYSADVLKSMRKRTRPEQIDRALRATRELNISLQGNFIFGDIAETKRSAYETLDYWKQNCEGQVALIHVQPYPGTALYRHCLRRGLIKDRLDFISNHMAEPLNMSDTMTDREFERLKVDIFEAQLKYCHSVVPLSLKNVGSHIYEMRVKCPYCNETSEYKNYYLVSKLYYAKLTSCRKCHMRFHVVSFLYKSENTFLVLIGGTLGLSLRDFLFKYKELAIEVRAWFLSRILEIRHAFDALVFRS